MIKSEDDDVAWHQAVAWIMREHEGVLDGEALESLRCWLAEAPKHRQVYEQARMLWLITGLLPATDG